MSPCYFEPPEHSPYSFWVNSFLLVSKSLGPRICTLCRRGPFKQPRVEAILTPLSRPTNPLCYHYFCYQLEWTQKWDNPTIANTLSWVLRCSWYSKEGSSRSTSQFTDIILGGSTPCHLFPPWLDSPNSYATMGSSLSRIVRTLCSSKGGFKELGMPWYPYSDPGFCLSVCNQNGYTHWPRYAQLSFSIHGGEGLPFRLTWHQPH